MRGRLMSLMPTRIHMALLRCLIVGGLLGVLSSLMVNSALVEVSLSPFFAVAFGLLFLSSAFMMAYQVITAPDANNRCLLGCFAFLNAFSGVRICKWAAADRFCET